MLNNFLKYNAAKSTLVKLGANKLADIIILSVVVFFAAPHVRSYINEEVKEEVEQVKDNQVTISKNQAVILDKVERHTRKIDSLNCKIQETGTKQDIIINALVESKSSIELLKDLYKSGVPGWGMAPVDVKKKSLSLTPFNLAQENTK